MENYFATQKTNFRNDIGLNSADYPSEYILYVTAKIHMDMLQSLTTANSKLTEIKGAVDRVGRP